MSNSMNEWAVMRNEIGVANELGWFFEKNSQGKLNAVAAFKDVAQTLKKGWKNNKVRKLTVAACAGYAFCGAIGVGGWAYADSLAKEWPVIRQQSHVGDADKGILSVYRQNASEINRNAAIGVGSGVVLFTGLASLGFMLAAGYKLRLQELNS